MWFARRAGEKNKRKGYDWKITHGRVRGKFMKNNSAKNIITELLNLAEVTVNGNLPWDIQVHNEEFYSRILHHGSLGAGESYMDGWWDCARLDDFFDHINRADLENKVKKNKRIMFHLFLAKFLNQQTKNRAKKVANMHYDLGNELFQAMLDSRLNYTCGYWKTATTLEQAQLHKLDLVCQKLQLKPGMRVLDIGCGWGALAKHAAEKYNVNVVGVTISKNQAELAKQTCAGLPIEIRLQDYRDIQGTFDRVVSLGMFEHVGHLNYRRYMEIANKCLAADGLFLLHTIGSNKTVFAADEWITKYIFSHGMLPSIAQIGKASEDFFVMEDWHNFGADYDRTLLSWHENFTRAWPQLQNTYNERFRRMWEYYLLLSAGGFRARAMQLWQIVFSKNGLRGGYYAPR